jgi:hypothetical protein
VNREVHARFLESRAVRLRPATRLRPRPSVTDKFEFVDAEYAAYQESDKRHVPLVVQMRRWMEVSRSGFYEWRNAPESATAKRRGIIALCMQKPFDESDGTYGYRRVRTDLVAWGVPAGPELVRSVMRELVWRLASRGRGGSASPRATARSMTFPIS